MTNSGPFKSLAEQQQPDGSFAIVGKHAKTPPFAVRLTLHAFLLDVLHTIPEAEEISWRLATYLLKELQANEFTATDTRAVFHALASLYEYDVAIIPAETLAAAVRFLVAHELAPGGPYRNALADGNEPDFDTNVSICRFIYHFGGPFPQLAEYVAEAQTAVSPYFSSAWPRQHMIAAMRRSMGDAQKVVAAHSTKFLCKDQHDPGAAYGMPALIDAHALLRGATKKQPTVRPAPKKRFTYDRVLACAVAANGHNEHLADLLTRMARGDRNEEIGLLALRLAPTIIGKRPTRRTLEMLGAANLYNWVAYTIYDDFLDDEGEPPKLPTANIALRTAVRLFEEAVHDSSFTAFVRATFDTVDAANVWELAHCRFAIDGNAVTIGTLPDYGDLHNLYGRSLTHGLPTLGALAAAGFAPNSNAARSVFDAFQQYLVIRQLNDDLRDWQNDLRAGHISYVVANTLRDADVTTGTHVIASLIAELKQTFLHQTLPTLCAEMLARGKRAHRLLAGANIVSNPNVIDELISRYEQNAERMITRHGFATAFMEAYKAPE